MVYCTVPLASLVAPLSVDESCTVSPMLAVVADSIVAIEGEFGLTTNCSSVHLLVAPTLLASPLYTACQKNVPALLNTNPFESGTTPLVTVLVPASRAFAVQVLFE